MTGYGRIDVLWYDLPQCYGIEDWRSVELNAQVRALQPHILINNRAYTSEDFATPEQHVGGAGRGRLVESCMTMNEHWGYNPHDHEWKSVFQLAVKLAEAAAGGGNLLLNVGPDPRGAIPPEAVARLQGVGRWLERHRPAIDGSRAHGLPWLLAGPQTWTPPFLNVVLRHHYGARFDIGGLGTPVRSAVCLSTGARLGVEQRREAPARVRLTGLPERWSMDDGPLVVRLELDGRPASDLSQVLGGADIFPVLPP
jgi:alpha-L-fucosidase